MILRPPGPVGEEQTGVEGFGRAQGETVQKIPLAFGADRYIR
jgi:hypothetical protein